MSRNHDRQITIFSPEGKLYQIEYSMKAVTNVGTLGIGVRGKGCVCLVSQKKVPDKLMDPSYVTNHYMVTPKIGCMAIGSKPDCKELVDEARRIAFKFQDKNGYAVPVHVLAQKIGKFSQIRTQNAGMRPFGCTLHFSACDDEKGGQLFRCDSAGHTFGWKSVATGPKDQEASNFLEKMLKKNNNGRGTDTQTIRCAIDCLQRVLELDMKPKDLEVSIVDEKGYRMLQDSEVDDHLTAIHEED